MNLHELSMLKFLKIKLVFLIDQFKIQLCVLLFDKPKCEKNIPLDYHSM